MSGQRDDVAPSTEELAATVMTLTAMLVQLRARLKLTELYLERHVKGFDAAGYRDFVQGHLEEVQMGIEKRTQEVMSHSHSVAIQEMHHFYHTTTQRVTAVVGASSPSSSDKKPRPR